MLTGRGFIISKVCLLDAKNICHLGDCLFPKSRLLKGAIYPFGINGGNVEMHYGEAVTVPTKPRGRTLRRLYKCAIEYSHRNT